MNECPEEQEFYTCPDCGKREPFRKDKMGTVWRYECMCISNKKLMKKK